MCEKCHKIGAVLVFAIGVLYLLQDLGKIDFWKVNWWTIAFLLVGLMKMGHTCCKVPEMKKKR